MPALHLCLRLSFVGILLALLSSLGLVLAQGQQANIPSKQEILDLLAREPLTKETWKTWKPRLLSWFGDRSRQTDPAWEAARKFMHEQAGDKDELPPDLAKDALAWYFVGSWYLYNDGKKPAPRDYPERAEKALRRSLDLDPHFAWAHRNLANTLIWQESYKPHPDEERLNAAQKEIEEARRLNPTMPLAGVEGLLAFVRRQYPQASQFFEQTLQDDPQNEGAARMLAMSLILNANRPNSGVSQRLRPLVERFPNDGTLACWYAVALTSDGSPRAAVAELERARSLGIDPNQILPPDLVRQIEQLGSPSWLERFLWIMLYFAIFYAVVMALMALVGLILANRTRGSGALRLLGVQPDELVTAGQVIRTQHESMLARLYALTLMLGLLLFYAAIPFILAGLLGVTGGLLYLIFQAGRIPLQLVAFILIVGGGMAWSVFTSLFTRPPEGSFGIPKTEQECPQLHRLLQEVAEKVDTEPVHEVYLAPGSAIGVHQEGRGPFGVFGVKRRVLTLGLSTMRFLSIQELRAILAHEYAHFSHKDTFYSRFIYQVSMSIHNALWGMGQAGGWVNYVNPFYWFLWLYYHCYLLLSAGFSRSREFLADRMACIQYGSDVFASALTKVATDGALFEMTIYDNINRLLDQQQAFVNMYTAFQDFRDQQLSAQEREELYQKLLGEKGSLFASHPTFGERIEAIKSLPMAEKLDATPALTLFENAEAIEQELTQFLTGYIDYMRQLQMQTVRN